VLNDERRKLRAHLFALEQHVTTVHTFEKSELPFIADPGLHAVLARDTAETQRALVATSRTAPRRRASPSSRSRPSIATCFGRSPSRA
jgi:hypothetical protein